MEEIKKRLIDDGIDVKIFDEEKVDLPTFMALTRQDFIDMNFSIVKTRKILMLQDEYRSKDSKKDGKIIKTNQQLQSAAQTLSDIVNDTIITPVAINDANGSYSILAIPASTAAEDSDSGSEMNNAIINIQTAATNNNHRPSDNNDDMIEITVDNHDYASSDSMNSTNHEQYPAQKHYHSLYKPHNESIKLLENLNFRNLLLQEEQGSILIELLDRGDFTGKKLPANFIKVIAVAADDFLYRHFGMKYPFNIGELIVEKIYEAIGHQCDLGLKKEWFGIRKGNNRTGRLHSRNERRKRLNRDLNTSLNMDSYSRYRKTIYKNKTS